MNREELEKCCPVCGAMTTYKAHDDQDDAGKWGGSIGSIVYECFSKWIAIQVDDEIVWSCEKVCPRSFETIQALRAEHEKLKGELRTANGWVEYVFEELNDRDECIKGLKAKLDKAIKALNFKIGRCKERLER